MQDEARDRPDTVWLSTIDRTAFEHDVIIRLGGKPAKRNKQLSKAVSDTSHTISLVEAKPPLPGRAARLLIGAGQSGSVALSDEAAASFARNHCQVELLTTLEAIQAWNVAAGRDRPA
jgi:hypothetical protein